MRVDGPIIVCFGSSCKYFIKLLNKELENKRYSNKYEKEMSVYKSMTESSLIVCKTPNQRLESLA